MGSVELDSPRTTRVVVAGAGAMGRNWMETIASSPTVELAGVADVFEQAAVDAVASFGDGSAVAGTDAVALAKAVGADAIIDVTIPAAHYPVTIAALEAGIPVLGEKPVAETVAQALGLAAAADEHGQFFMVSQSRRWNPRLFAFRRLIAAAGGAGILRCDFFKGPHFGGFREEMAHPLLVDMAIHMFDSARFLLQAEPVSVFCDAFNPKWSWYSGDAAATTIFEMDDASRFILAGSWCSEGSETSWDSDWRASCDGVTVQWDGDGWPTTSQSDVITQIEDGKAGIALALDEFVLALHSGKRPMGEVHENIMSLLMVEAAVRSAASRSRVLVHDVLQDALSQAIAGEASPRVRARLESWRAVGVPLVHVSDAVQDARASA